MKLLLSAALGAAAGICLWTWANSEPSVMPIFIDGGAPEIRAVCNRFESPSSSRGAKRRGDPEIVGRPVFPWIASAHARNDDRGSTQSHETLRGDFASNGSPQTSIGPRQDLLEVGEEVPPAGLGPPVGLLLIRPEARLLHAQVRASARRGESPRDDTLEAVSRPGVR
jgi:hypothetical protein